MDVYQRESTDCVRKRHICDTLSVLYAVLINCFEKVCYSPSRGYSLILSWLLLLSFFSFFALLGDDNLCSLLGVGGWDNHAVDWEAEVLDEELNTLVGEEVVRPSPGVDLVEASLRLQRLDDHHNVEVSA